MPNIGERKEIGGTTGEWNGSTWKRVYTNADSAGRPIAPHVPSPGMEGAPTGIAAESIPDTTGPMYRTPEFEKKYADAKAGAAQYHKDDVAAYSKDQQAKMDSGEIESTNTWGDFGRRAVRETAAEATPAKLATLGGLGASLTGVGIPAGAALTAAGSLMGDSSQHVAANMGSEHANPRSLESSLGHAAFAGLVDAGASKAATMGVNAYRGWKAGKATKAAGEAVNEYGTPAVADAAVAGARGSGFSRAAHTTLNAGEHISDLMLPNWAARGVRALRSATLGNGPQAATKAANPNLRPPGIQSVGEPVAAAPTPQQEAANAMSALQNQSKSRALGFAPDHGRTPDVMDQVQPVGSPIRAPGEAESVYGRTSAPSNAPGFSDSPRLSTNDDLKAAIELRRSTPTAMSPRHVGQAPTLNDEIETALQGARQNLPVSTGTTPRSPHVARTGDSHMPGESPMQAPVPAPTAPVPSPQQEAATAMSELQTAGAPPRALHRNDEAWGDFSPARDGTMADMSSIMNPIVPPNLSNADLRIMMREARDNPALRTRLAEAYRQRQNVTRHKVDREQWYMPTQKKGPGRPGAAEDSGTSNDMGGGLPKEPTPGVVDGLKQAAKDGPTIDDASDDAPLWDTWQEILEHTNFKNGEFIMGKNEATKLAADLGGTVTKSKKGYYQVELNGQKLGPTDTRKGPGVKKGQGYRWGKDTGTKPK